MKKIIAAVAVAVLCISLVNIRRFLSEEKNTAVMDRTVAELHESSETEVSEQLVEQVKEETPEFTEVVSEPEITEPQPEPKPKPTILPAMEKLVAENEDTFGWVTIGDIDNVVLQGEDNEYYLSHDFSKNEAWRGELFVDHRCDENSNIIIVYGHDNYDKTCLGSLDNFRLIEYLNDNKKVSFSSLYEERNYEVIGVGVVDYSLWDYHNELSVSESWIRNAENWLSPEKSLTTEDEYLLLSTCSYEYETARLVVLCQRCD